MNFRENYEERRPLGGGLLRSKREWFESLRLIEDFQRRHGASAVCGHAPRDPETLRDGFA
jgi:hypothetical protein